MFPFPRCNLNHDLWKSFFYIFGCQKICIFSNHSTVKNNLFIRTAEGTTKATFNSSAKRPSAFSSWTEDILTDLVDLTPVGKSVVYPEVNSAGGGGNNALRLSATAGSSASSLHGSPVPHSKESGLDNFHIAATTVTPVSARADAASQREKTLPPRQGEASATHLVPRERDSLTR